ncbi:MAG: YHYH domain-containing protein [Clostridium fessum]
MKRFKKFGTALLSCMMLTASFATVSNMTMITVEAHPGRTDAQGGHHDYKNKSGLGSYHYHCGDHEAHLHPNGVCPYKNGAVSNENTSGQTQTLLRPQSAGNQNQVTEQMNTYQPVFDANYYYKRIIQICSRSLALIRRSYLEHFYTCGMAEGRRASENFDVSVYKANNPDLVAVFGDDLKAYYTHYVQSGQLENRVCK